MKLVWRRCRIMGMLGWMSGAAAWATMAANAPESAAIAVVTPAAQETAAELLNAKQLAQDGKFSDALAQFDVVLKAATQAGNRQLEADVMSEIAVIYRKSGKEEESLALQKAAADIYAELGDLPNQAKALRRIGVFYRYQGQLLDAIAAQEQALALLEQIADSEGMAQTLTNLGIVYGELGRLAEAKAQFERALEIYRKTGNQEGESYTLADLGQLFLYLGDSQQALTSLNASLAIKTTLSDERRTANTLLNIGTAHKNLGNFQEAFTLYYQALDVYKTANDQQGVSIASGNIGSLYEEIGEIERAKRYQMESLEAKRSGGTPSQVSVALTNLASLAIKQADFAQADAYLQEALSVASAQETLLAQAHVREKIGLLHLRQERFSDAAREFSAAQQLYHEVGSKKGELDVIHRLGETAFRQGAYHEALAFDEEALRMAQALNDMAALWSIHDDLGKIRLALTQDDEAITHFQASIATLEQMRSYLQIPELRQFFMQGNTNPYIDMVRLLLARHQDDEALWYLERLKARTFLELAANAAPQSQTVPALIQEEQQLAAKIRLLNERFSSAAEGTSEQYHDVEQELYQAKEQYENLLLQIKFTFPEYYRLKIVDAEEIRMLMKQAVAFLEPDVAILEYFLDDERLSIWVITADSTRAVSVPVASKTVMEAVLRFRNELRHYRSSNIVAPLQDLYSCLIAPVEAELDGITTLGVIPFQVLHFVPFGALVKPGTQGETPSFLMKTHALFSLPSLSMLPVVRARTARTARRGAQKVLGMADGAENLPGAAQELRALRRVFPTSVEYIGKEATKERVFAEAPQYDILHFAMHGVFDKQHPMFSYLELASEPLYAKDVFGLSLNADLVTLSGCETFLPQQIGAEDMAELVSGDELVGFIRAFMYAGTPTVLASLWQVNDTATQDLMSAFYQRLPTLGKARALQQASLDVMQSTLQIGRRRPKRISMAHPFFWAPFVVVGDWK